jgi:hypothetical protein
MQGLLALWDDIEKIAKLAASGAMHELPISGEGTAVEDMRVALKKPIWRR